MGPAGKIKKNGLSKRSSKTLKQKGVWKRRFFVLKPESCQLVYFESSKGSMFHSQQHLQRQQSSSNNNSSNNRSNSSNSSKKRTREDALGEMDLDNGFHYVDVVTRSDRPKECTLVLGTRMLSLKAETEVEMDMWLEAFAAIRTQWENRMKEKRLQKEKDIKKEKEAAAAAKKKSIASLSSSSLSSSSLSSSKTVATATTATHIEPDVAKADDTIRLRKGVLVKRGDFRRSWKARYFVLNDVGLAYYSKQTDEHPKRLIEYRSISGSPGVKISWVRPNALKIHVVIDNYNGVSTKSSNNRTYYIHARTMLERDSWINDIAHNIDLDRKRNLDRGTMAHVDDTVGQKGRVLVA